MSNDQPRPGNRYSRFSRSDVAPPTAEPSLEEIAARALNRPRSTTARAQRGEIPQDFGSPEGFGLQQPAPPHAPLDDFERDPRRHAPMPHIPEVVPVERAPAAAPQTKAEIAAEMLTRSAKFTRREAPPAGEVIFAPVPPPPPMEAEEIEVEVEPEPLPQFMRTGHDVPELPISRPVITAEFETVAPEATTARPKAPAKQRFKMPSMPSIQSLKERGKPAAASDGEEKGPNIAQRALAAARARVVPALQRSALWLAHNLQRRELRKRYSEAVIFAHNRILDRKLEKLFFIPTLKGARKAPAPDEGILYDGPIPAAVFDWVFTAIPDDLREFVFVDFRASRGRTVLLAAKRNFDRIVGFEFDPELFDDLQMNIAQFPRSLMTCRNIDCYRGDLDGIRIPDQPSVLWFSGAWREDMIPGVMDYVRQTYQQSPRRLYIVFANAGEKPMLEDDGLFYRVDPGINQRLKLKLLSPMEFQVYRTIT